MCEQGSDAEYAYAATTVLNRSAWEKEEIIPNTINEAMTRPAKAQWKTTSDKEVASLERNNVCSLLLATFVPTRHKIIDCRRVF